MEFLRKFSDDWCELLIILNGIVIGQVLLSGDMTFLTPDGEQREWRADLIGLSKSDALSEGFERVESLTLIHALYCVRNALYEGE